MLLVAATYVVTNLATDLFTRWWIRARAMSTDARVCRDRALGARAKAPAGARRGPIVAAVAMVAALAPALPLADPNRTQPSGRLAPPLSPDHPLGSDHLGRDLLSRVVWGARVSLVVGVLATLLAMLAGTAVGLVTGFYGGFTGNLAMRGIDLIMAFPTSCSRCSWWPRSGRSW